MFGRLVPLSVLALAACEPVEVRFPVDAIPVDPEAWPSDPHLVPEIEVDRVRISCRDPIIAQAGRYLAYADPNPQVHDEENWLWSGGIIAGDLNDDGFLELIAPTGAPQAKIYQGMPHGPPVQRQALEGFDLSYGIGGSVADYDADGDLDVYVMRWNQPNVLIRNEGDGTFTDATAEAGVGSVGASMASSWADYDRDGDLDLFVAGYGDRFVDPPVLFDSALYENQGDGTFVDRSADLPPEAHVGFTMATGFHDVDRDGWPDLYLVNDIGRVDPNVLLMNRGGELLLDDNLHGLDLGTSGAGLGAGDLNGDGLLDFIVPQWRQVSLMLSDAETLTWVDHAQALGVRADQGRGQDIGWGGELADIDNDGDLDGIVAFGHVAVEAWGSDNPIDQPDALYLNDDGAFVDVAERWGVDDLGAGRGFAVADLDNDGWLDLAKRDLQGPDMLYISQCGDAGWVRVQLRAPGGNRFGVGARVAVSGGGLIQEQVIRAGGTGFGYGGPPEAHFGLADAEEIRIDVLWPDGMRSRVEGVAPHQVVTITRTD